MTPETEPLDEAELIARCRRNDQQAFELLVERYAGRILNLAHRMVGDAMQAEDLMQDTFLSAWRNLPQFRAEARFSTWLYRIATNKCTDWLRSHRKRDEIRDGEENGPDLNNLVVDPTNPEQELSRKQVAQSLEQALQALPVLYREPFVLKHVEGLSYEEISEILNAGPDALKMRVYKARVRLRAQLARRGEAGEQP
jgi:RNA polymerase sigma-70 factor (ECF subfamily)